MVQSKKRFCLLRSISQKSYITWFWFMVFMCTMIISSRVFSIFSKCWFSGLLEGGKGGVKGQKIAQNDKKFCLSCLIYCKPYIWSSFVVHKCKLIISPGFFYFFKILFFWIVRRVAARVVLCTLYLRNHTSYDFDLCCTCVKGYSIKWPKMTKKLSQSICQELYLIWLWFLVHMCKMMTSLAICFHFFKILIFQVFQSSSINAKVKFWGVPHLLHMCMTFGI